MNTIGKKLLILGGGLSHIPMIKLARTMGLYTIVMDKNPEALGFRFCNKRYVANGNNKNEVFKVAKKEKVNGILPTGDYAVLPAAYASERLGLPTLGYEIAKLALNKGKLFQKFSNDKVPIAKSIITSNNNGLRKIVKKIGLPVIFKPATSVGGSRGVIRANTFSEINEKFTYAKKYSTNGFVIIEKFIDGLEHTIESITINKKTYTVAISDKKRIKDTYCVGLSLDYPSIQNKQIQNKLKKAASKAIKSCGITNGVTHIEAISYKNKVYVIDFGARGGAGGFIPSFIVPKINGIDLMEKMILLALGEKINSLKPKFSQSVVYRFFNFKPGKIRRISGIKKVKKYPWLIDIKLNVKKGDEIKILSNQLLRPGYFVAIGKNSKEVQRRAKIIEETVKIETYH